MIDPIDSKQDHYDFADLKYPNNITYWLGREIYEIRPEFFSFSPSISWVQRNIDFISEDFTRTKFTKKVFENPKGFGSAVDKLRRKIGHKTRRIVKEVKKGLEKIDALAKKSGGQANVQAGQAHFGPNNNQPITFGMGSNTNPTPKFSQQPAIVKPAPVQAPPSTLPPIRLVTPDPLPQNPFPRQHPDFKPTDTHHYHLPDSKIPHFTSITTQIATEPAPTPPISAPVQIEIPQVEEKKIPKEEEEEENPPALPSHLESSIHPVQHSRDREKIGSATIDSIKTGLQPATQPPLTTPTSVALPPSITTPPLPVMLNGEHYKSSDASPIIPNENRQIEPPIQQTNKDPAPVSPSMIDRGRELLSEAAHLAVKTIGGVIREAQALMDTFTGSNAMPAGLQNRMSQKEVWEEKIIPLAHEKVDELCSTDKKEEFDSRKDSPAKKFVEGIILSPISTLGGVGSATVKAVGNLVKEAAVMEELSLATQSVRTAGHVNKVETGTKVAEALGARTVVADMLESSTKVVEVVQLEKQISAWLGEGAKLIRNEAGDVVFISKDGLKCVRFDFNKTKPHNNPHAHVEIKIDGKWVKSGQIYPTDVPHN